MADEIEKQYNELKGKLELPEFRELDFEFEIRDFEETNFLLREIVRRISEKFDFYATMMEKILQPDPSNLYAMHETRDFSEDEKNRMYGLYRRLMALNRQSIEVSLQHDEKSETEFIGNALEEWKILKKEILAFVKRMKDSWKTEVDIKEDVGYLG